MDELRHSPDAELLLREAGAMLGISRKGVQHLVNRKLLRHEVRTTAAGTRYGVVFLTDVLRLATERLAQVREPNTKRPRGRPATVPALADGSCLPARLSNGAQYAGGEHHGVERNEDE